MNLESIRKEIDLIDTKIITLLAERAHFVVEAGKQKKDEHGVRDSERVVRVIAGVREKADHAGLDPDLAERIYRDIIAAFVDQELKNFRTGKEPCDDSAS